MRAWSDILRQVLLCGALCALFACGMAWVGSPTVVGSEQGAAKEAFGRCRQCGNPIRIAPKEWCTSCQTCGQLTNLEQLYDWNKPESQPRRRLDAMRWVD